MLQPRIIVSLLLQEDELIKTKKFKNPQYIGDPINTVKIFNEKKVDELSIFDIGATRNNIEPNYNLIEQIAAQSRMPVCYGGGIKNAAQAQKIFNLGIEKIALSSAIFQVPNIIETISEKVGAQSVVAVLDIKKNLWGGYDVFINNGKTQVKDNLLSILAMLEKNGVGEIVINHIDNDGTGKGYDFNLIEKVSKQISKPLTVLGGAGSLEDIKQLFKHFGIIGAAAGSLFVFKGRYNAVLINYPDAETKNTLYNIDYAN
ncbi:AglZ/HisF2 family acetamidino modification protein [Chryseobacterium tructae]|uniref:imidazole glycerol-phosphate synthase n=1 Tax=Chryseobacterium tructae TaxID=1037380 RepID=A0ABV7XTV9_9FLAO|nr:AglZ/HisF2 family acetamidino modification protein [Chryseobacterium tructae]MDN3691672.1 AglZ/HisF2 family acetamidino modification protein [Chryseobacterium tructae]